MFITNTIKTALRPRRRRGFTLVEMLVAMGVAGILLAGIATATFYAARSCAALLNYIQLDNQSRRALDIIVRDVRQADYVSDYKSSGNQIDFQWVDPSDNVMKTLTFVYDATTKQMKRLVNGVPDTKVLLSDCNPISGHSIFEIYTRKPNSADLWQPWQTETSNFQSSVKAVKVQWICSRTLFSIINSESVQTTMIVLRNQ